MINLPQIRLKYELALLEYSQLVVWGFPDIEAFRVFGLKYPEAIPVHICVKSGVYDITEQQKRLIFHHGGKMVFSAHVDSVHEADRRNPLFPFYATQRGNEYVGYLFENYEETKSTKII